MITTHEAINETMLDTITPQEFDARLDAANVRLAHELVSVQERVQQLEALVRRKEAFAQKLDRIVREIEQDEAEIRTAERNLRPRRVTVRTTQPA